MSADWEQHDPGAESLVLAGPVLIQPLGAPQLGAIGLGSTPVIAIDGGIRFAASAFLWAGDGDSGRAPGNIPAMIKKNQDETDLRFCLNGIRTWRWHELHLFGFIGERRDHELANFGEIHAEMHRRPQFSRGVFYGGDRKPLAVFYPAGAHNFTHQGLFSVLAFAPVKISLAGKCRYPADNIMLEPLSGAGISNEATGLVNLRTTSPVAVFLP